MYWGIKLQVFGAQTSIALHCARAPSLSQFYVGQTTISRFGFKKSIPHRSAVMDANVPDFVSTVSKTIVIIAVNFLLASFAV